MIAATRLFYLVGRANQACFHHRVFVVKLDMGLRSGGKILGTRLDFGTQKSAECVIISRLILSAWHEREINDGIEANYIRICLVIQE